MISPAKPNSHNVAYRRIIAALIQALCAVPKEARREWIDEIRKGGPAIDDISPDDLVVRQVLVNLDVAENVANARREELKPKLYPIVGRQIARRRAGRAGSEARPSARGGADDTPPAA